MNTSSPVARLRLASGRLVDRIKINRIVRTERDGHRFWVKERRPWSGLVAGCANRFFRAAGNPVVVLAELEEWQRWEIDSYLLLHGAEGYAAFAEGKTIVWAEEFPGQSLDRYAAEGRLEEPVLRAAAREMARAHGCAFAGEGSYWSHGDPHMGNFIYDGNGRARLIDFEVSHRRGMEERARHADDLLVFLQDLMGHPDRQLWTARARLFLEEYLSSRADGRGLPGAIAQRLDESPRSGMGRLWWAIRTAYLPGAEQEIRIAQLQTLLGELA